MQVSSGAGQVLVSEFRKQPSFSSHPPNYAVCSPPWQLGAGSAQLVRSLSQSHPKPVQWQLVCTKSPSLHSLPSLALQSVRSSATPQPPVAPQVGENSTNVSPKHDAPGTSQISVFA